MRRKSVSRGALAKKLTADLKMLHERIGVEALRAGVDMEATDAEVGQRLEHRKRPVEVLFVNAELGRFASHVEPESARYTARRETRENVLMRPTFTCDLRHGTRLVHGFHDDMTDPLSHGGSEFL